MYEKEKSSVYIKSSDRKFNTSGFELCYPMFSMSWLFFKLHVNEYNLLVQSHTSLC